MRSRAFQFFTRGMGEPSRKNRLDSRNRPYITVEAKKMSRKSDLCTAVQFGIVLYCSTVPNYQYSNCHSLE